MTFDQINDWFDNFYDEYVEKKKPVRGRAFGGGKIEIWARNNITIVLHNPHARGVTQDEKVLDMVRMIHDDVQSIHADLTLERFKRVVSGEEPLTDSDWSWEDE